MSSRTSKSGFTRQTSLAACDGTRGRVPLVRNIPDKSSRKTKDTPELRAIARSRVDWRRGQTQDQPPRSNHCLRRTGAAGWGRLPCPAPTARADREVEYELEKNGTPFGLYDIRTRRPGTRLLGWLWRVEAAALRQSHDRPQARRGRRLRPQRRQAGPASQARTTRATARIPAPRGNPAQPDPDRPTLHKKSGTDDQPQAPPAASADPDRPGRKKAIRLLRPPVPETAIPIAPCCTKAPRPRRIPATVSTGSTDPNRPRLMRGKPTGNGPDVLPSLMGLPADMQQAVAVSDAKSHPEHPWNYTWANPDDEGKMKEAMEDIARQALGLTAPPAATPRHTSTKPHAKPAPPPAPASAR